MPYLTEFLTLAVVHALAVASPGPDFVIVSRNSLVYSRKTGVFSAIGIGLGILLHVCYSLLGIGWMISQSILLFSIVKYLGAAYLVYLGIRALLSKPLQAKDLDTPPATNAAEMRPFQAIRQGFLTNVLNPKCTLFFLSLFTQLIDPNTPPVIQLFYGLYLSGSTIVQFSLLAYILSNKHIKSRFQSFQHRLELVMGGVLITLGIKIALTAF